MNGEFPLFPRERIREDAKRWDALKESWTLWERRWIGSPFACGASETAAKYERMFWQDLWRDDPEGLERYQERVAGIERRLSALLARRPS